MAEKVDIWGLFKWRTLYSQYCKRCGSDQVRMVVDEEGKSEWFHYPTAKGVEKRNVCLKPIRLAKDRLCYACNKEELKSQGKIKAGRCGQVRGQVGFKKGGRYKPHSLKSKLWNIKPWETENRRG